MTKRDLQRAQANNRSKQLRSTADTYGRCNRNKRGPKTDKPDYGMMKINHRTAVWAKANGYPYKQAHILSDADYAYAESMSPSKR